MEQRNPFRHVYTGVDKTVKRAVPLSAIKRMKNLDLSLQPNLEFARDMFLFSFYTRGMSFIDMAHLKREIFRTDSYHIADERPGNSWLSGGKMYAGDCRQIPGRQSQSLSFAGIEISF